MPCREDGEASTSRASLRAWRRRTRAGFDASGRHLVTPKDRPGSAGDGAWTQSLLRVPHITSPPPTLMMRTPTSSKPA